MIVVTGCAGFIGYHTCQALLARGERVLGLDNLSDYYDPALKQARLDRLTPHAGFAFLRRDIAEPALVDELARLAAPARAVIHLAAQAGVRYSLVNPYAYVSTNQMGQVVMLEAARRLPKLEHFVYASSSSVYGGNTKLPFAVADRVDAPISLYAASKKADELMTHTYSHLYGLPASGLRFFTVYGPWGRPDMAAFIFVKNIVEGRPIQVFNHGQMERDFTYIDDIVAGILGVLACPPPRANEGAPHRLFNLGNHRSEKLLDFIAILERELGRKAEMQFLPMQPGDVPRTFADIEESQRVFGFEPKTTIAQGLPRFVAWYRDFYRI